LCRSTIQDGWYWDEDCAYEKYPVQLFAMYYLTDTTRANGCLRVIPADMGAAPNGLCRGCAC
jgi:hypothetical protein